MILKNTNVKIISLFIINFNRLDKEKNTMQKRQLSNLQNEIIRIKKEKNILLLVHNYISSEIQDVGDFCGDTLEISKKASCLNYDTIMVCGVRFMAETVKILSPNKTVLIPAQDAICPMVNMIDINSLNKIKEQHPKAIIVCYVNSNLETKINSDICCTSSNAKSIINSIPKDTEIIFIPDKNLGQNIANEVNRKNIITLDGYCPIHNDITQKMIIDKKKQYPNALVLVHPECTPEVVKLSDIVASTGKMIDLVKKINNNIIIVATEPGITYRLKNENPDKKIIPISENSICHDMKKINIDSVLESLNKIQYEITIEKKIIELVRKPMLNMLKY